MADNGKRPEREGDVASTLPAAEASEDTAVLLSHLVGEPAEGTVPLYAAIEALVKQEEVWRDGLEGLQAPATGLSFKGRLRRMLLEEADAAGWAETPATGEGLDDGANPNGGPSGPPNG